MESTRVAVFVDTENLTGWLKAGGLETLLRELAALGQVVVRRAYGTWSHKGLASHQSPLNRLGFDLIHTYHPVSGKNSADIRMTVDIMEYAWRVGDIDWFVLATGDSDFSPLFQKLREMGKGVIGAGPRSALSEAVKSSCSRFIYTDQVLLAAADETSDSQKTPSNQRAVLDDAIDLLEAALQTYDGPANIAGLKLRMLELDSAFDERRIGYRNFLDFLRSTGVVQLTCEGSTWYASLPDDESPAGVAAVLRANGGHTPPEAIRPADMYLRALRKKKWRAVPGDLLLKVYRVTGELEPLPRPEIAEQIIERIGSETTLTEVRKALALLLKTRLFLYHDTNEEGDSLWKINRSVSQAELFKAVDIAMAVRLLNACTELSIPLAPEHLAELVLGSPEVDYLADVLKRAQEVHRTTPAD